MKLGTLICPEGINLGRLFPNKPWEKLGLATDTHGDCWNHGFINGFNHLVYVALIFFGIYYGLPLTKYAVYTFLALKTLSIIVPVFFFLMEMWQAKGMRDTQVWEYWRFWEWHGGKHQDYILPTLTILILNNIML